MLPLSGRPVIETFSNTAPPTPFSFMKPLKHTIPALQNTVRPVALAALSICLWASPGFAQDAAPAGASEGGTAGETGGNAVPSSAFRTGESGRASSAPRKSPYAYDTGDTASSQMRSVRRTNDPEPEEGKAALKYVGDNNGETSIVAPGFYGRAPRVVTPGQGEYARPKYRYGVSVGIGYDDNTEQTPSVRVVPTAQSRNRSGFTSFNGHWDAQWLKPRTVFTLNLEVGGDVYFDRPSDDTDFNARLGLLYVNKIDQRTQFTANGSFAYLSQPDYSNLYASTNQIAGDYFTGSTKFDLGYRWTPVFSTLTSASVNILKYTDESVSQLSNSYWTFIFGNEFRFKASPRLTYVAEGRYAFDEYIDNSSLDSQTAFVLAGLDWIASRRLTGTVRAGASFRTFDVGGNSSAPYAEVSLNYLMARRATLVLNARYGYEQSSRAGDESLSYRLGLLYQQAFTSRFSGNAGFNFIHTDFEGNFGPTSSSDVYDFNAGLQYRFDRHFSVGVRYSYTLQDTSTGLQDFDRNRVLLSGHYEY